MARLGRIRRTFPELEDHLNDDHADRTLGAVTARGRYAELFGYDDKTTKPFLIATSAKLVCDIRMNDLAQYRRQTAVVL